MEIVSVDITNCMFFVVHVYQALCSTYDLRGIILEFCGFTNLSSFLTPSGGSILFVLRFYQPLFFSYALRGPYLFVLRFYGHSLFGTASGGSIFRCTTKDRGERRAKGLRSRPLDSGFLYGGMRGDVRTFLRVRIGAFYAI